MHICCNKSLAAYARIIQVSAYASIHMTGPRLGPFLVCAVKERNRLWEDIMKAQDSAVWRQQLQVHGDPSYAADKTVSLSSRHTQAHTPRHRIDGAPCQDMAATKDMRPAQAKSAECSIGGGTCKSCKLLKLKTNIELKTSIMRPDSVANIELKTNIGGLTVWLTSEA